MNDIDTASLSAQVSVLEARAAKAAKLKAALGECAMAFAYDGMASKHGNVLDMLRHLADLMVEAGDKSGWALWLSRAAGVMDEALVQAQEALGD